MDYQYICPSIADQIALSTEITGYGLTEQYIFWRCG